MQKPFRLLLLGGLVCAVLLLLVFGLALHSGVQTWAARKALAKRPELNAQLGGVSAGFRTVEFRDLHLEQKGAIITLPAIHAELSTIDAGMNQKVNLQRLIARGWTLDLTGYKPGAGDPTLVVLPATPNASQVAPVVASSAAVAQVFQGIFAQTTLPFDFSLDSVDLEGDVILPPSPEIESGKAHLVVSGGGVAAGKEGAFDFRVVVTLKGPRAPVDSLTVAGRLGAAMDTPRTFSRLATKAEAEATGPKFPNRVKLATDLVASRAAVGENYTLTLANGAKLLVDIKADLPAMTKRLGGAWKIDLRDTDLMPFALGRPLPVFDAAGEGSFALDTATGETRATGRINASLDKLGALKEELATLGVVSVAGQFDLMRRGKTIDLDRLSLTLSANHPVATVQLLQPFEFNFESGELKVADATRELLGVQLQSLPLAWAQPFLKNLSLTGGDVRGEFVVSARDGGLAVRPKSPIALNGVSLAVGGQPQLRGVDFAAQLTADYTPVGWQVELAPLTAKSGDAALLTLEAKAGRLIGKDQPIKAVGKFSAALPAVLAQPAAGSFVQLTAGDATGEFVASIDGKTAVQLKLALANLAVDPKITAEKLPAISADLRADITPDRTITLNAPLTIERDGRKSDVTLSGTIKPGKTAAVLDAHVTSDVLVLDDAKILGAPVMAPAAPATAVATKSAGAPTSTPPWASLGGQIALALKKVIYSDAFQASNVTGTIRLDAGTLKLEGVRASLGNSGEARVSGRIGYDAKASQPYELAADLAVNAFDPMPLFKALNPGQPATVEGSFNVTSKLAGRSCTLGNLADQSHGDFLLTSKGGVFRGLPVSFVNKVEAPGKIAAGVALIGNAISAVTGRKDNADTPTKAQAVADIAKALAAIPYDQLNVVLVRDAGQNTVIKDFSLIAPELRLTGNGKTTHEAGTPILDETVALEFRLSARGHVADLLKSVGVLDAKPDELGYTACPAQLKIGGTLSSPDAGELNRVLANLAIDRSGVTEKAADLWNKLMGK